MDNLQITPASFMDAMALQKEIAKALKGSPINIDLDVTMESIQDQELGNSTIESLIKMILSLVMADSVIDALFKCAEKALYHKQKVDRDFFENVDNRELFYPIMIEVAKTNLSPFFRKIGGTLSDITTMIKQNQKQA